MSSRKPAAAAKPSAAANKGRQQQQQEQERFSGAPANVTLTTAQANTLVANWNLMATLTATNAEILSSAGLSLGIDTGV